MNFVRYKQSKSDNNSSEELEIWRFISSCQQDEKSTLRKVRSVIGTDSDDAIAAAMVLHRDRFPVKSEGWNSAV